VVNGPDDLPGTEIVSRVYTAGTGEAWVERDAKGRLYLRCGCGTYKQQPAMAPALQALTDHVESHIQG
jgi:hypothetical protein